MKYIFSTLVAALIGFVIWAYLGNNNSKADVLSKPEISDGTYAGLLEKDSSSLENVNIICQVNAKVVNGSIVELDSFKDKSQIWASKVKPALLKSACISGSCGKFAQIKTNNGLAYKVVLTDEDPGSPIVFIK